MEELIELIDNLKSSLDKEEIVKKIKKLNKEIVKDKELIKLIEEYKKSSNEELKKEIYSNKLYKEYKESETDLNILIMTINKKLKEINNKRHCG